MTPYYDHAGIQIWLGDCRDVLPGLENVDAIVTDPPYCGVLDEKWDRQWPNDASFLEWLEPICRDLEALTVDNGSLYMFCSARLHARIDRLIDKYFNVIGSCIWDKGEARLGAAGSGIDVTSLRTYWSAGTERIVFAEKRGTLYKQADDDARDACGYWTACEKAKQSVFGDYLRDEFKRAGITNRQVAALFPSKTGGLTGCVSNWLLGHNVPTHEQYKTMKAFLNGQGDHEYLRKDYEEMRKDYEEMRKDYEEMRRPFNLTADDQWGDVWRFAPPAKRQHPAEKPLAMISQMVRVSSRKDDTILDPFMGSGTTLVAAKELGRKAVGIEIEEKYCEIAARRLAQEVLPL